MSRFLIAFSFIFSLVAVVFSADSLASATSYDFSFNGYDAIQDKEFKAWFVGEFENGSSSKVINIHGSGYSVDGVNVYPSAGKTQIAMTYDQQLHNYVYGFDILSLGFYGISYLFNSDYVAGDSGNNSYFAFKNGSAFAYSENYQVFVNQPSGAVWTWVRSNDGGEVPEPSSIALVALAGIVMLMSQRHRLGTRDQ